MEPREILRQKRDGGALSARAMSEFIQGYVDGTIGDEHAAALLATIFQLGLERDELYAWTRAMLESGERLAWPDLDGPVVDKHSTGGVGDKVSIPLAPALAACGAFVPMISGRGLGHTAGTLDKLESLSGLSTELSSSAFAAQVREIGLGFSAQTSSIVPADKKLYALRDRVGLVESMPLIASSILSKKLAEGLDALVLDVKFGSGAFVPEVERGERLAHTMIELARSFGLRVTVFHTAMEQPLGNTVGHAMEMAESFECLAGGGPADLRELVTLFGGELLAQTALASDSAAGAAAIGSALDDGRAAERMARAIGAQGGDAEVVHDPGRLPRASDVHEMRADRGGYLVFRDTRGIGAALCALGGGRLRPGDRIQPGVGLRWLAKSGARVESGQPLVEVHHESERGLNSALSLLSEAVTIQPAPAAAVALVRARIGAPRG